LVAFYFILIKVSCLLYTIGNLCSCFSRLQCLGPMSFLATMNLWEKERTDSPVWKFYVLYIINNLVNPCAWWPCGIRTTVLFVGGCLPGKFQQVDSASATDSRRRLRVIKCQSHKIRYSYFFVMHAKWENHMF